MARVTKWRHAKIDANAIQEQAEKMRSAQQQARQDVAQFNNPLAQEDPQYSEEDPQYSASDSSDSSMADGDSDGDDDGSDASSQNSDIKATSGWVATARNRLTKLVGEEFASLPAYLAALQVMRGGGGRDRGNGWAFSNPMGGQRRLASSVKGITFERLISDFK